MIIVVALATLKGLLFKGSPKVIAPRMVYKTVLKDLGKKDC